jgi:hypothetical protein
VTRISREEIVERARSAASSLGDDVLVVDAERGPDATPDPDFDRVSDGIWVKAFIWVPLNHDDEVAA